MNTDSIVMIIPAYEPENILIDVVRSLKPNFKNLIVIDDGSGKKFNHIFDEIKHIENTILLTHDVNQGKGAALKTAFKYILKNMKDASSAVMCDSDGQHLPKDVLHVTEEALAHPKMFIFGTRTFSYQNTPLRSWIGNTITQFILKLLLRTKLSDTQTGLRAYPVMYLQKFIDIPYDRYEYDTESIILMTKNHWTIKSVPIETVYIDGNKNSHFNPIVDSLKVYWVILRFSLISILSFLIDLSIFSFMTILDFATFPALLTSKFVSAVFNFIGHRFITFHSNTSVLKSLRGYTFLWCFNIFIGTWLIDLLVHYTSAHKITVKVLVDCILFVMNFFISKKWIFKSK